MMYLYFITLSSFLIYTTKSQPQPVTIDWRTYNAVLPVPTQQSCGHASVINALDAISSIHKLNGGDLLHLSKQQIYDCNAFSWCPCGDAGNVTQVYQSILAEGFQSQIDSEDLYPYTGDCTQVCLFTTSGAVTTLSNFTYNSDQTNQESMLYDLIRKGPLTVQMNAKLESFQTYTTGVYDDNNCDDSILNHTLLLVGYGTDSTLNTDYWIARNSWGTNWGESGYIRIVRDKNMCGIGNGFSQPQLSH